MVRATKMLCCLAVACGTPAFVCTNAVLAVVAFFNRFNVYIESPDLENDIFHANFRRRFCMPYNSFLELVKQANQDAIFCRWREGNVDAMS